MRNMHSIGCCSLRVLRGSSETLMASWICTQAAFPDIVLTVIPTDQCFQKNSGASQCWLLAGR